jgi:hypothetical protein
MIASVKKFIKNITVPRILLILAASYAAYNFGLAGGILEDKPFSVGGLILGIVVNVSIAIAAGSYGSIKGDKRASQAKISFIALIFISAFLIAPAIYYLLPRTFLPNDWLRAFWSLGWALAGDGALVLAGAVAGKSLITLDAPANNTQAVVPAKPANAKKRTAPDLRSQCERIAKKYACTIPQCGWSASVDALIAVAQKGKDPDRSANAAHSAHFGHNHYSKVEEKVTTS